MQIMMKTLRFVASSAEVAQGISDDSYGLIFGINRFLALSFQSLLTFLVADENGFALGERAQFVVYGIYFLCLGGLFAAVTSYTVIRYFCCKGREYDTNDRSREERKESVYGDSFAQL